MGTKKIKAKNIKVGDRIMTTNGAREVLAVVRTGGSSLHPVEITVQCPASADGRSTFTAYEVERCSRAIQVES